jgi:hypothetical protein
MASVARQEKLRMGWMAVCCLLCIAGCQERGPVSIHSDDPDLKINAIQRDAATNNTQDIATMVEELNSDDAAMRFYSIEALRRLTHEDFRYRYYEDDDQRAPAIGRWKEWLKLQGK